MHWTLLFLVLQLVIIYAHDADIHTLQYTKDDFDENIHSNNHFVMFYAPWCGHCNRLAPTWEKLAETHNKDEDSEVTIAKVDCTTDTPLCSEHDVTGYPTLRFFKQGQLESVKFRGTRDLPSLTSFINEQLGNTHQDEEGEEVLIPDNVNGLIELTDSNFQQHIALGKHFVKFYAPWCGHCQKLAPTWDALANAFSHDVSVQIGKIDCTTHRTTCTQHEIKGYPTLMWIEDGKKIKKYQGERSYEALKDFVTQMLGSEDKTPLEDKIPTESPVLPLSADNFKHGIEKGMTFVKFFAPWCGHCKRLAPTWEELGTKFIGKPNIKIAKVDCTIGISKELCSKQEVDGFPTLILYKEGEKVAEYTGSRSLDDLYEFIMRYSTHDEL